MKKSFYAICVIAAGMMWGIISIFIRSLTAAGFSSLQIMTVRAALSVPLAAGVIAIKNHELFRVHIRDIWMFIGTGVISLTFFSICYFRTIVNCGASVAVVLLYTSPIFIIIFSALLFHEKITFPKVIAIVMTTAGCILVVGIIGSHAVQSVAAFLIGLGAGLGYALYSIFGRVALKKYDTMTVTFYTFVFAALFLIPISHPADIISKITPSILMLFFGIAIVCTLLPYLLYTYGLSGLETGTAAILATVEPLVGTLLGIFAWGESANIAKIIGIVLILGSIIIIQIIPKFHFVFTES